MKYFEEPEVHVIVFSVEDVIASSVAYDNNGDWVGDFGIPEIK